MREDDFLDEGEIDQIIAKFIQEGIIELHGIDSFTGDFTYRLTPKAKELFPELYQEHFSLVNDIAFSLWEKGYIEMKFTEDEGPMVMLKDIDYINDVLPKLPQEERHFIENMLYFEQHKDDII